MIPLLNDTAWLEANGRLSQPPVSNPIHWRFLMPNMPGTSKSALLDSRRHRLVRKARYALSDCIEVTINVLIKIQTKVDPW